MIISVVVAVEFVMRLLRHCERPGSVILVLPRRIPAQEIEIPHFGRPGAADLADDARQ